MNVYLLFIPFDLEHGGDQCGITQLSAVLFRLGSEPDVPESIKVFNEYVLPPTSAKWNPICIQTTGLHAGHPSILNADEVEEVWGRFYSFLQIFIGLKERGVLVAWNGGTCDLEWIYRLIKAPGSKDSFPKRKYFLDP